ncbi:MAG: bifunctional DNA-formamidopyrimidine glycosylase/DNA-(apurinic or apyrimidinic site) lyase [Verrucomicrobiales bacterium]|nr:bifunctional DNA-formamidopyrimidine glycosylase/DNA-(apurinic or apyrimidinic site) lyase [Verrucomicrobiales bacterium]
MPELPEVEILARHLRPRLQGQRIHSVVVQHLRIVRPDSPAKFAEALRGTVIQGIQRRGKFLIFGLQRDGSKSTPRLVGHLGMTGRLYLSPDLAAARRIKHLTVAFDLGDRTLVFEDPRRFGRLTLDTSSIDGLGPEPDDPKLTPETFREALLKSRQAIKVKLLDQSLIAGVGHIYASEALHLARLSPRRAACRVSLPEAGLLLDAIRKVLLDAIRLGGSLPLDLDGHGSSDGLFYYGAAPEISPAPGIERFRVYDRGSQPCTQCGTRIRRLVQASRSTFFCPKCQT